MTSDDGMGRLRAFFDQWQVGTQLTTRGIQVGAGIANLRLAEQAAEQMRAQGLLVMESIGATHLWRRCEPVPTPAPVKIPPSSPSSIGATASATKTKSTALGAG